MYVLGIESSCDETAAAIVSEKKDLLSHVVWSQQEHLAFGGVVPEIAARAHLDRIDEIVQETLDKAHLTFDDLSAISVAAGPGLIGGVIVGVMTAKSICAAKNIPFVAVNHLEGHALTARLTSDVEFPYLLLLVSGGHCQLLVVEDVGKYKMLGTTIDDSSGEAFDKVSKMLGLGYPGGPKIEKAAQKGNPKRFRFPSPMKGREGFDFSFSGLKTAVRHQIELLGDEMTEQDIADISASFQKAVLGSLLDRVKKAITLYKEKYNGKHLVVAGGVASNLALRESLTLLAKENNLQFNVAPVKLCTDNGAMIAWAGLERFRKGYTNSLDFKARPRWPLESLKEGE
ncbi:MAG: tRNA (adenosine(37)-N6)-threonylcarbamoyltransferase complex transferase subunit TsaD [Alphaproteobacteria bacterium]|nr:tRNA (adenosine(37)-N6)-threonylcarbamoyltransferase complex transferase subunit TsaD [Alphaproteobacteria bacterium]